ncbi:STAS domain protein [Ancylostoma caninum]|uniref:STAS domain protein n=1 Tax=Ancylostoma caninum TaxID=29170 RepID=A0A368GKB9_ANCCA|nr:STAS domain protein [Ancylostoma caninum]
MLYSRVPAIKWLRHYRREDIAPDTAAGLTLAIYNVPQGMTGLTPIDVVVVLAFVTGTVQKLKEILAAVPRANVVALALSMSTVAFLSMFKRFVDPCLQRRKISLPSELLARDPCPNQHHSSLPAPKVPRFELVPDLLSHATSIAVVSYVITVSMGKLFARKHKYQINNDQEMLALGLVGCFSSLFSVFPTTTSLSRSLINDGAGAKTQVSGLVSSCAILGVILFVAPVLEPLPTCVLSSIVIVALFSLLKKVEELPILWRFSKTDVAVWVGTALVTFCWDIIEGLACGVVIALMTVIIRTQRCFPRRSMSGTRVYRWRGRIDFGVTQIYGAIWRSSAVPLLITFFQSIRWLFFRPSISLLGKIAESEYRALDSYTRAIATDVPVIRFDAPVIFTNADLLKNSIRDLLKTEQGKLTFSSVSFGKKDNSSRMAPEWTAIILDCRSWTYTDAMGVDAVREINEEMLNKKVLLIFANLKSGIRIQYARAGLFKTLREPESHFLLSISTPPLFQCTVTEENQFCPSIDDAIAVAALLQSDSCAFFHAETEDKIAVM